MIKCQYCDDDLEDRVYLKYSNVNSSRAKVGQHIGNIYYCEYCDQHWLDNFLTGTLEPWNR